MLYVTPEQTCPSCKCRFSWNGRQWQIATPQGLMKLGPTRSEKPMPAPEVARCVSCHSVLDPKATVVEVVDE